MESGKKWAYLLIVIFVVVVIASGIYGKNKEEDIKNNIAYSTAVITKYNASGGHGGSSINYQYSINNKICDNISSCLLQSDVSDVIVGRRFPLVYSSKNENHFCILITPEDFQRFNLAFPDSLNWILPYVRRGK